MIISLLFVFTMGACGGFGGCGACSGVAPLPGGKLPTDQTIEGGAQIRVTPTGFTKLTSILPGIANQQFTNGFCVPAGSFGFTTLGLFTGLDYCNKNSGTGCTNGCKINVAVNQNGLSVTPNASTNTLRVNLSMTASTAIKIEGFIADLSVGTCNLNVTSNNFGGNFDIALGVRNDNGELELHLAQINQFNLNMDFSGCGFASSVAQFFTDILDSFVGQFIIQLLTPYIDSLLQQFLPNPLGIANMMDIGALVEGVSPGTEGFMEARIVPGGYANITSGNNGAGLSLGVITGLNADEDPTTRTPALDSEPALCVPPMSAPVFTLPPVPRSALGGSTFRLDPADQFNGAPDPSADIAMGISETTLDLAGHHLVTSGGMCLGVGSSFISQLNVGTIGILVPSLAELQSDKGNDPLLLVTRPQRAIDFTIGDNTTTSPALTIHLQHLEVDFYAFIYERYVRAFTMDLTMNVGINLTFQQTGTGAVIKPQLVGISSSEVQVKVLNSQFVRETAAHLEGVLPSVFDLVTPLLGNLPDIPVPTFAGFSLNNLSIQKVVTSQDKFLALFASLGSGPAMRVMAQDNKFMADAVQMMDMGVVTSQPKSSGGAKLVDVKTPAPEAVREQLINGNGAMPTVTFQVDRYDSGGRELEWSWNLNGGWWRPFTSGSDTLVIADKAFAWQGKYEIGLVSRVKGDYRTTSEIIRQKVTIDSVGPQIFADKLAWDGNEITVPAWDVVGGHDFEVAWGKLGDDAPKTQWVAYRGAGLARETAAALADDNGELLMFARDELGNQTIAVIAPFHGQAGSSGCSCETTGRPGAGSLILFALVGFGLVRPRRRKEWLRRAVKIARSRTVRTLAMFVAMVGISSLVPACSCGKNAGKACETNEDCGPETCDPGQLPFCIDNTCVCSDDIIAGRIGPYSDVGFGGGKIWVSAYASSHGDLVVAEATGGRIPTESWEWVDGVPDGPVIVPGSKIRGGIDDAGADVGMYTSIAVTKDGTPMVSYFDKTTASLKFAAKVNGTWQIHTVQQGTSQIDPGSGGTLVGMYTSISLRGDDGRPGIAYLAHVQDTTGLHAEVRYAAAQTAIPTSSTDWTFWRVDTAPVPDASMDVYPLPAGLGLFIDSARNPMNQAPVVVYYDRANGDLKLSRFNPQSGQFATPVVLDGSGNTDAGWSPSVQVDSTGVAHVVYVSATGDDLKYTTDAANAPKEIVDDGYRIVGTTVDGLPKPEFHFVGDDANIILPPGGKPIVVYQDATTQELLYAQKGTDGKWTRSSVAGATNPWPGAYGFFASGVLGSTDVIMSSWVIDQPADDNWVEVFSKPFVVQ